MGMMLRHGESGNRLSNFKLCIACCCYDNVTAGFAHSLMQTCVELTKQGVEYCTLLFTGNCHVDDARNKLVRDFLATDCTHLMFLDADLRFDSDDVLALIKHDKDVVGAIYPYKEARERYVVKPIEGEIIGEDGLLKVSGIGTGFLKIRRSVIERLMEVSICHVDQMDGLDGAGQIPIIFERIVADNVRLGGDLAFCWKWRSLGGEVFADPSISMYHIGLNEWAGSYKTYLKRNEEKGLLAEINLIKQGNETAQTIYDLCQTYGNDNYAATSEMVLTCICLARETVGNILECGTGLTTLAMAAANPDVRIYALEQDVYWASYIQSLLDCYELKNVRVLLCPLKNYGSFSWYDVPDMFQMFDLAVCDGPRSTRGGFYEVMHNNVKPTAPIVFDDYGTHVIDVAKGWGGKLNVFGGIRKFAILTREKTADMVPA